MRFAWLRFCVCWGCREIRISFPDLERQAGITLPESSRAHVAHWHSYQGSAVVRAIVDAGWHAARVDLNAAMVSLLPGPAPARRFYFTTIASCAC